MAEKSKFQKKLDQWSRAIFLTKEGKPKSATLLYSFALALLFIIVYGAAYVLLTPVLENALSTSSAGVRNLAEIVLPAIAGSIPCVVLSFAFRTRRELVPQAYLWLAVFLVLMLLFMALLAGSWDVYRVFLFTLALPFAVSLVIGGGAAWLIWRRRVKKDAAPERPGYYNS